MKLVVFLPKKVILQTTAVAKKMLQKKTDSVKSLLLNEYQQLCFIIVFVSFRELSKRDTLT